MCSDNRCSIHENLRDKGFRGCVSYECFGAGQHVSQEIFKGNDWRENTELSISDYSNETQISNLKNCLDENIKVIGNIINRYFVLAKIPDKWRMKLFKLLYYFSKLNENKYTYENLVMLQNQGWVPIISVGDWKKLKNER